MPQLDLSTLSGAQLRQLLDSARSRGQAALAYQILQEMAARREGREAGRRAGEPRVVALDLGDPLERTEDDPPEIDAASSGFPDDERALALEPVADPGRRPARRRKAAPAPIPATPTEPADANAPEPRPGSPKPLRPYAPRPPRRGMGAGFIMGAAAGVAAGVALGWGLGETAHDAMSPAAAAAAPLQTAALAPPPAPVAAPVAVAEAPPEAASEPLNALPPAEGLTAAPPASEIAEASPEPAAETPEPLPERAKAEAVKASSGACASEPTVADRTICGDPALQRLQRDLREAYADALEAHEDRALLRQHQLEWRDARNDVAEPDRLARLYEQRIRKLNAAAAAAREGR